MWNIKNAWNLCTEINHKEEETIYHRQLEIIDSFHYFHLFLNHRENYLEENKILYKYQTGFCSNHSMNVYLIKGFEEGKTTGMVLIDLQKAYDTIYHKILLNKMRHLGFSQPSINWFMTYLSRQTFTAKRLWACGVVVSMFDFHRSDRGSNPGRGGEFS